MGLAYALASSRKQMRRTQPSLFLSAGRRQEAITDRAERHTAARAYARWIVAREIALKSGSGGAGRHDLRQRPIR
jgi:hypothetical protein